MKTVVIEVRGGVVQDVYSEEGTRIIVLDWDDDEGEAGKCVNELTPLPLHLIPEEAEELVNRR